MAVLIWKHGTTATAAKAAIHQELAEAGHESKVQWSGNEASASIGWGAVLSARGEITEDAVVLEKCSGVFGDLVLRRCHEMLARLFPNDASQR